MAWAAYVEPAPVWLDEDQPHDGEPSFDHDEEPEEDEWDHEEEEEDDALEADRPDFTESTSVVGLGRVQIETGYTFVYNDSEIDNTIVRTHSAPETLFRIGLSDWWELRLGWNYLWEEEAGQTTDGAEDLIIGAKVALTEQCGCHPQTVVILETSVPTGADAFSTDNVEFGMIYIYSWELCNGWSVAGQTGYFTAGELTDAPVVGGGVVERIDRHNEFIQSAVVGIPLTECVGSYIEYFGIYPEGSAVDAGQNFIDGGFTWLVTDDLQFDARVGVGLNDASDDFFTGVGAVIRY